tara:strand:- start:11 stop:349 length:339 start_codon:yes stop_codon:yes gene_type:complete
MKARTIYIEELATSAAVLYTVANNTRAKLVLVFVSNSAGATRSDINITINFDSTEITILGDKSLSSGDYIELQMNGGYIMLEQGYTIKGVAGGTGVSCMLTVEEVPFIVSTN